ncbi:MAG TPA: aldose epimerase family protein [Longimicrobiales bacterium]|nr:aldose epimerase family protein [Longimicrobiales bacterium]
MESTSSPDSPHAPGAPAPAVGRLPFGRLSTGESIDRYSVTGAGRLELDVITYGARIQALRAPDAHGRLDDVVLGYDDISGYEDDSPYHGAVLGRVAGRIRGGEFTLDGVHYRLPLNLGAHHIHGGPRGVSRRVWEAEPFVDGRVAGVVLRYLSPDGEEGYPGTASFQVTYTIHPDDTLRIEYVATADRATPVNLSQHVWFNLAGEGSGDVLDHVLMIDAEAFAVLDPELLPTGGVAPVAGTPLDFRSPRRIGERIRDDHPQIRLAGGYDHYFILSRRRSTVTPAARLSDPRSGRVLELYTSEPGLQLFTGNFRGEHSAKRGHVYRPHAGVCLETQHFPDAPNQPHAPSVILRPGEALGSWTEFRFRAQARAR